MTHNYKRHGTTTLFAALAVLAGTLIGQCMQRHSNQEFIRFLNGIERQVPAGKVIHVILDNYAAHQAPKCAQVAGAPSPLSLPLHADLVLLTERRRRLLRPNDPAAPETGGTFPSLVSLQEVINRFIEHHNQEPSPFVWKADPNDIIAAGHQTLQTIHWGRPSL